MVETAQYLWYGHSSAVSRGKMKIHDKTNGIEIILIYYRPRGRR
jgi:hypothetical protein